MPFGKWENFEDCVRDFMSQRKDEESAKRICGALEAHLGKESFSWTGSIKQIPGVPNLIRGKALHPIKTYHYGEWPEVRVYLEEELQKSAQSLAGKPLLLDHYLPLKGEVLDAEYEDGAIEYFAKLDDQEILNKIRDGKIRHCSVEFEWQRLERVDGIAPLGIDFTSLSLLEHFESGDPLTTVELFESIFKRLKEAKGLTPPNPKPAGEGSETEKKEMSKVLFERIWNTRYINDLPDAAFALIQKGGQKDETGRTVPRSLRRLPHHRADGSIDPPHLRNALARAPQMKDVTEEERNRAIAHLKTHAKALGIGEFAEAQQEQEEKPAEAPTPPMSPPEEAPKPEFEVAPEPTLDELIESVEEAFWGIQEAIDTINKSFSGLDERLKALEQAQKPAEKPSLAEAVIQPSGPQPISDLISRREVLRKLEAIIPADFVIRAHGIGGFQKLVQDLKRVKREIEGMGA